jgi:hypothetical protein
MNEMFVKKIIKQKYHSQPVGLTRNLVIGFLFLFVGLVGVFVPFFSNNIVASANSQEIKLLSISSKTTTEPETLIVNENLSIQKSEEVAVIETKNEAKKPKKVGSKR